MKAVALGLLSLVILASCGRVDGPASSALSSRTGSPSSSPVGSRPIPSPAPGYKTYVSPHWKYSLEYPEVWYDLADFGAPDTEKYFSDLDIGAPILLRANDIWATVSVNDQPHNCSIPPGNASRMTVLHVSIAGVPADAYISPAPDPNFRGGDGLTGVCGPWVLHGGWCYTFSFLTASVADTQQHLTEIEHIYSSFRFNR